MNSLTPINFAYVAPQVEIPENHNLTELQLAALKIACLKEYALAMQTLEESVADVAVAHPDTLSFARALSSRLFDFIQAYAEILLEDKTKKPLASQIALKVNELLFSIFDEKNLDQFSGSVGLNILSIRKVFKHGNLRELMFLAFKTTWKFTNAIFQDIELVGKINQKLNWKIDIDRLRQAKNANVAPYQYGPYAAKTRAEKHRVNIDSRRQVTIQEQKRIPLSEREIRLCDSEKLKWIQGSHRYRVMTNTERTIPDVYLTAMEAVSAPGIAGISGTTDQVLKMSQYFGLNELEKARLVCLGWMVDGKHHTVNEIMVSSKSFGFDYTLSPTSYKQIYTQDLQFLEKVEEAQRKRGSELPDFYLSAAYVSQKAQSLFD